jgi:polar amino acid transport system substrate-binding protein
VAKDVHVGAAVTRFAILSCLLLSVSACGLPRDPDGTLAHVRGQVMRVGVIPHAPWTVDTGGTPDGIEPQIVQTFAHELGARIEWVRKPEHELLRDLHQRQLHVVIGGLTDALPWKQEVAFTRPYFTDHDRHVLAAAPGENAWLVALERSIERQRVGIGQRLQIVRR